MTFFKRKKKKYCYAVIENGYYDEECIREFSDVLCIFSSKEKAIAYIKRIDPLVRHIDDKYWHKALEHYNDIFYEIEEFEIDEEVREDD